jgi:hypothetical protein
MTNGRANRKPLTRRQALEVLRDRLTARLGSVPAGPLAEALGRRLQAVEGLLADCDAREDGG